jgi:ATP-dependent exoDNAse (exonuclease V) beta subunit
MFQGGVRGDLAAGELATLARGFVAADERWTVKDLDRFAAAAARAFAGMWAQPELRAAVDGAECHYEVPISAVPAPRKGARGATVLRGIIDCLAFRPDGRIVVVDFKTGARRDADRRQLRSYVDAVRAMHPGSRVDGCLIYAP